MIWIILALISLAVLLYVFIRKLPQIRSIDFVKIPKALIPKKINNIASKPIVKAKEVKKSEPLNSFSFFSKPATSEINLFDEADMLFKHNNYNEAEKLYIKIAALNPKNVKVYNRLGILYMERKNYSDAKEAFLMAVRLDPQKASRHYNLATAYEELREYRNALESLENAIKIDGKNKKYQTYYESLKQKVDYRYKEMKRTDE